MRTIRTLALSVLVAACGGGEEAGDVPADTTASDTTAMEDHEAEDVTVPTRADEIARDAGSRPQAVMDFVGIERGDRVADIFAGGGYFTYLLSERVGPDGEVYAQGYSPGLAARVERGDLADAGNVVLVDSLKNLPERGLDHAIIIRGYHLFEDPATLLDPLMRALEPGGTVGIVEVRLGQPTGHDMETHRMGERTVIEQLTGAGFEYVGESEALYNPEDDHTTFYEGRRHESDRMLLKFAKPGERAPATTTARAGS